MKQVVLVIVNNLVLRAIIMYPYIRTLLSLALVVVLCRCNCSSNHNQYTNSNKSNKIIQAENQDSIEINNDSINTISYFFGVALDSIQSESFLTSKSSSIEKKKTTCQNETFEIRMYKLEDIEGASDPILNVLQVMYGKNILYKTIIGAAEKKDLSFVFTPKNKCLFAVKYYSSPIGYIEYYVYDLKEKACWKTRQLDELETLNEDGFNLEEKEYQINGEKIPLKLELIERF